MVLPVSQSHPAAAHAAQPSPLHQFEVVPIQHAHIGPLDVTVTNQALWTGVSVVLVILVMLLGVTRMRLVPGRMQALVEMTVDFVSNIARDNAGKDALAFLPLILTIFLFVSCLNLTGMVPFSFTATSQITTTGYMAVLVFVMVVGVGLYKQGFHFFGLFLPPGTPLWLAPFIIPLEIISFLARPLTLAVRLAANMVAGHILLKVFAAFCISLLSFYVVASALPLVVLVALTALEVFVALLQAYIFTVLTCVYLNDALHGH